MHFSVTQTLKKVQKPGFKLCNLFVCLISELFFFTERAPGNVSIEIRCVFNSHVYSKYVCLLVPPFKTPIFPWNQKTIHLILIFIFLIPSQLHSSYAQTWIRAGYRYASDESPIPDINSALFTHLICGFANVSSSSYQLIIPTADQQY